MTNVYQQGTNYFALLKDKEGQRALSLQMHPQDLQALATVAPAYYKFTLYNMMATFWQSTGGKVKEVLFHLGEKGTLVATVRLLYGHTLKEIILPPRIALVLTSYYTKKPIYVAEELLEPREDIGLECQNMTILEGIQVAVYMISDETDAAYSTRGFLGSLLFAEPQNLDFQDATSYWFVTGPRRYDYEIGIESSLASSQNNIYIKSTIPEPESSGALAQYFLADSYRGKQVHFSSMVKTDRPETRANLWIRIDELREGERHKRSIFERAWSKPSTWTPGWHTQAVALQVPEESVHISFGVVLQGKGQAWLNQLAFHA